MLRTGTSCKAKSILLRSFVVPLAGAALAWGASIAGAGAQSLTVWDDYTLPSQTTVIQALDQKFEAAHPGVKINRTGRTFDDLAMTLKLTLSSGDGPVLTKANQGAQEMGAMVKQKLLLPVDEYITKYGWDKKQSDGVLARDRWSDKGEFGVGPTYGISGLGEMVGLYYNAKNLKDAGIDTPPATFEDLVKDVDAVKAKGAPAFMMGTVKGHMALHMFAAVSQAMIAAGDRKPLDDIIYGRGGSWNTPYNLAAVKQVQDWATGGAFNDGYQGISDDDAAQLYAGGQGAFLLTGTWRLGDLQQNPDIHFMAVPPPSGVKNGLVVGGIDLAWAITALAKDKATQDLAGEYMNYMVSDEAASAWAGAGYLPAVALEHPDQVKVPPLLGETLKVWDGVNAANALGHYPDWASPTMLKTLSDNLARVLAKDMTPADFISAVDKDYQDYMASLKKG
ncbi:extracellular solute-binding protein [Labrys miyagiensis]|uniref:extracellular solute-binding protein n=1 Tax=Labrys miyagiensis TaxID=346912 RepID=UPI0024E0E7FF|nr:extracellular solute-binding protein [Labrys miyagiensis]